MLDARTTRGCCFLSRTTGQCRVPRKPCGVAGTPGIPELETGPRPLRLVTGHQEGTASVRFRGRRAQAQPPSRPSSPSVCPGSQRGSRRSLCRHGEEQGPPGATAAVSSSPREGCLGGNTSGGGEGPEKRGTGTGHRRGHHSFLLLARRPDSALHAPRRSRGESRPIRLRGEGDGTSGVRSPPQGAGGT